MSPTALMLAAFASGQPATYQPAFSALPQAMPANGAVMQVQAAPAPMVAPMTTPAPMALPNGTTGSAPSTPGLPPSVTAPYTSAAELDRAPTSTQTPEPAAEEEKWFIMRRLEGTSLGTLMADRRFSVSGWTQLSYTQSTTDVSNSPVVWNDRADKFLLNQTWLRFDKAVDTEAKEATFGYRVDAFYGTDYRFTLQRDLFNNQLINNNGDENLYGADLIQFYASAYLPNLFQGTELRAGRLWTPFGVEGLEGSTTPFVSRSYAFNWAPPFTHMGISLSPKFSDSVSGIFMLANGNDVFFGNADEPRFVGALTWEGENDAVTFGTSLGRGKYNSALDQNHINVFDLVWTHTFNDKLSYTFESIYGYQYGVTTTDFGGPLIDPRRTHGTANWYSVVQYLNYQIADSLLSITRLEFFNDTQGSRTGSEGLYTAVTTGLAWSPVPDVTLRPLVRYDYNNYSKPFEGRDNIWTGAMEMIVRY